jgi:hypothetical protein
MTREASNAFYRLIGLPNIGRFILLYGVLVSAELKNKGKAAIATVKIEALNNSAERKRMIYCGPLLTPSTFVCCDPALFVVDLR